MGLPNSQERERIMTTGHPVKTVLTLISAAMVILVLPAAGREIPAQLPDPDGRPADQSKPVQVFILMGQWNMLGFGRLWDPNATPASTTRSHL